MSDIASISIVDAPASTTFAPRLVDPWATPQAQPVIAFVEAINRRDMGTALNQLAPSCLHHGRVNNYRVGGVRLLFTMLLEVFPDLHLDIRDMRVDGHRVVTRVAASGTHTGSFLGKTPTGRAVVWQSLDIAEVAPRNPIDTVGSPEVNTHRLHSETPVEIVTPQRTLEFWEIMKRYWDLWSDPSVWREIGFVPAIAC